MAGIFELFLDEASLVRFRLVAADGEVLAVSRQYPDKWRAAAAIQDVRECAGTGLIRDLTPTGDGTRASRGLRATKVRAHLTGRSGSLGVA